MADREKLFASLPEPMKKINQAVDEMNKVVTGGKFDPDQIWGKQAADDVKTYMDALPVDAKLKEELNKLLNGAPSMVFDAINTMIKGLQDVVGKIQSKAESVGNDVLGRIDALNNLSANHQANNYQFDDKKFGLFPAITGIVTAAAGAEPVDFNQIMGPINQAADYIQNAMSVSHFVTYAISSIDLLNRALNTANQPAPQTKKTTKSDTKKDAPAA